MWDSGYDCKRQKVGTGEAYRFKSYCQPLANQLCLHIHRALVSRTPRFTEGRQQKTWLVQKCDQFGYIEL